MIIWDILLKQPLANLLFFFYQAAGANLAIAIILTAITVGLILIPVILPSLKSSQKMQTLKPELDALNQKYKNDKQTLAAKQLELYKNHGVNPLSGFLPMIFRILVVIALYQVLNLVVKSQANVSDINQLLYSFIKLPANVAINTKFLYLDLLSPDTIKLPFSVNFFLFQFNSLPGVFLLASAAAQYLQSYFMSNSSKKDKALKPTKKDTSEMSQQEMAEATQKQMAIMMPLMTIFIGYRLSSGLVLSWLAFSVIAIFQQLYVKKLINTESNKVQNK